MKRTHIIVHHTGAEEKDAAQIRRYHLSLGWRDVGYNFIIERSGRVVKGRSLTVPGAHCRAGGMNRHSIGVAVIGNMEKHGPTPLQQKALLQLLTKLIHGYGIPVENILGHREVPGAATVCPGRFTDMAAVRRALGDHAEKDLPGPVLWRVQAGTFHSRKAAENYARRLRRIGIDAFVVRNSG